MSADWQTAAVTSHADVLQAGLNLTEGPILQVSYFDLRPRRTGRLLIAIHHLVVDGVSWRILFVAHSDGRSADDLCATQRRPDAEAGENHIIPAMGAAARSLCRKRKGATRTAILASGDQWSNRSAARGFPLRREHGGVGGERGVGVE